MERVVRPTSAATSWMRRRRGSSDARVGVVVTPQFYAKIDVYVKVCAPRRCVLDEPATRKSKPGRGPRRSTRCWMVRPSGRKEGFVVIRRAVGALGATILFLVLATAP